jgi:hypothetical protein
MISGKWDSSQGLKKSLYSTENYGVGRNPLSHDCPSSPRHPLRRVITPPFNIFVICCISVVRLLTLLEIQLRARFLEGVVAGSLKRASGRAFGRSTLSDPAHERSDSPPVLLEWFWEVSTPGVIGNCLAPPESWLKWADIVVIWWAGTVPTSIMLVSLSPSSIRSGRPRGGAILVLEFW